MRSRVRCSILSTIITVAQPSWLWRQRASCPLKHRISESNAQVKLRHLFRRTATVRVAQMPPGFHLSGWYVAGHDEWRKPAELYFAAESITIAALKDCAAN